MDFDIHKVLHKVHRKVHGDIKEIFGGEQHSHTHGAECNDHHPEEHTANRFHSFAPQSSGNAKWYVDGCSYFWAVSEAIEQARESIYILDWWLSPEIYLRRPPSANERYRLDNMLKAAAERGVKVSIIVYKEVEAALTLKSSHTRQALEALHPNIGVFRHPDHAPTGKDLHSDLTTSFSNLSVNAFNLSKFSGDTIKAIYGTSDDIVLFWAHHEKLLVVDRRVAFMGGLDLCFGRWDTQTHPIADAHPGDMKAILFPGQDYNNARIFDFDGVDNWNQNKLDRTKSSRMGWSDVSISLDGPIVDSLVSHFTDRWNYIYNQKYGAKNPGKYHMMDEQNPHGGRNESHQPTASLMNQFNDLSGKVNESLGKLGGFGKFLGGGNQEAGKPEPAEAESSRGFHFGSRLARFGHFNEGSQEQPQEAARPSPTTQIQLVRSCCEWSSGHKTEHSIANAYIDAILKAEHFIYIENQFFITATADEQRPVNNKIGGAMVERILRAHRENRPFKIIVMMPAVPAFAGDLKAEGALGTRAIMEFQYNSISRGGYSIIESLQRAGIQDVSQYIAFYNLRNYDRINLSSTMAAAEQQSGVSYEAARKEHDDVVGAGYPPHGEGTGAYPGGQNTQYERYQAAAANVVDKTWDSVAACYMDAGPDLRSLPWQGSPEAELNAFVSEELYIHSKLLIADDRLVICGSANLNDRSQLGSHDSEIAVVIEDSSLSVGSYMGEQPYNVSAFASTLRRTIFRKHLGLLPHQDPTRPDTNWSPISSHPNHYDWNSPADLLVQDPMSGRFQQLWASVAKTNTEVFSKVFHNVPNDHVRTWEDYDNFFSKHFVVPGADKDEKGNPIDRTGKVEYGHVVPEEFPGGVAEVKEWLSRVRGSLVEMPLAFLVDVDDIAKEGLSLNALTDELYT